MLQTACDIYPGFLSAIESLPSCTVELVELNVSCICDCITSYNLRDAMGVLYSMGVNPKLYRLWYLLNINSRIRVKTAFVYSDWYDAGELIGQGTGGGAVVSAGNLDYAVDELFIGSDDELVYRSVRIQPIVFQD